MIFTVKISAKRQITIPLKIMVRWKLNPGDYLIFEERNGHIEIKPKTEKFTIREFLANHRGQTTKRLTNKQIRKARTEAWLES